MRPVFAQATRIHASRESSELNRPTPQRKACCEHWREPPVPSGAARSFISWTHSKYDSNVGHASVLATAGDVVRSPGKPLESAIRGAAEARFGFDFSRVRIHEDVAAARSAAAANVRAYTIGSHIAFGGGEYRPQTGKGIGLLFHELVHVVQQGAGAPASPIPRSITRRHDAVEEEAHALAGRRRGGPLPPIFNTLGPVIACYPKEVEEPQKRELEALQHGQTPLAPVQEPPDPFQKLIKDLLRQPPPTRPGSWSQIEDTIPEVKPMDLFDQPAIQTRMRDIAEAAEGREKAKPGAKVAHSANVLMDYWKERFVNSVNYILYRRAGGKRRPRLDRLYDAEWKLVEANPADLVAQVEALRHNAQSDWLAEVQRAADQFVTLAANEALFVTVHQAATSVKVFGLPESIEGTVKASDNPDVLQKGSARVAPSVAKFMRQVQKEAKIDVVAENYTGHELANPWLGGDPKNVGKYSFDVHLEKFIKVTRGTSTDPSAEGFYERQRIIDFFLAVDRAAHATNMEWVAFYNDFEVEKEVNEKLGKLRIGFSGGGGSGQFGKGSFHHGPEPYVLHVHFNIMPVDLKEKFDKAQAMTAVIKRIELPFLEIFNPR